MKKILSLILVFVIVIFSNKYIERADNIKIYSFMENKIYFLDEDVILNIYSNVEKSPFTDPNQVIIYKENIFDHFVLNKIEVSKINNYYKYSYYVSIPNLKEERINDYYINIDTNRNHLYINLGNFSFFKRPCFIEINNYKLDIMNNLLYISVDSPFETAYINYNISYSSLIFENDLQKHLIYNNNNYFLSEAIIFCENKYYHFKNDNIDEHFFVEWSIDDKI